MSDLHARWSHRWITKKARSRRSPIEGLGVIVRKAIKKGETVAVLGGVIVPRSDIQTYWSIMGPVGIQIDDDFFIVPTTRKELAETGVFNHSCEPNCGLANSVTLVAMRDIRKGEELTFDYAFSESVMPAMRCNCKTQSCRKRVTRSDWKLLSLRKKYGRYFSPYLRLKFSR